MNSPKEIAEQYIKIGEGKTRLSVLQTLILGVMAGMFIALAGAGATVAGVSVEAPSVAKLVGAVIFPGGLAMVLIAGSELFTGNCLLIIPLLEKKVTLPAVLRNLILVYLGNLAGGTLVAAMLVYSHLPSLFAEGLAKSIVSTAVGKVSMTFTDAFLRGVLCNILVCIAVWMAFAAKTVAGKLTGLFFPVMLFVLCGYEHVVANMYYIGAGLFAAQEYGLAAEGLSLGSYAAANLLPVTLGNIVGGAAVGAAYWAVYLKKR